VAAPSGAGNRVRVHWLWGARCLDAAIPLRCRLPAAVAGMPQPSGTAAFKRYIKTVGDLEREVAAASAGANP